MFHCIKCALLLLLTACASQAPARIWQSHASTVAELRDELDRMLGPFPDVLPWRPMEQLYDNSDIETELWDFGYLACNYDADWTGEPTAFAWFRRPAEVGRVYRPADCAVVSAVLRDLGVPCAYELSQGTYLMVPGRLWPRAVQGLQANAATRAAIAFVPASERPLFDFYEAAASSLDELRTELTDYEQASGRLPDCVAAWDIPGWGSERMDEMMEEGSWWSRRGYEWGWCSLKANKEPTGIGSWALFLRSTTIASSLSTDGLGWVLQELHLEGIPAHFWLSQGIYLDVPARREHEALRILHASTKRPENAGSLYPLK